MFDINEITLKELDYTVPVSLTITEDGFITALVGYFDVIFDGPNMNSVSIIVFIILLLLKKTLDT